MASISRVEFSTTPTENPTPAQPSATVSPPDYFNVLPNEIFLKILKSAVRSPTCQELYLVSKKWKTAHTVIYIQQLNKFQKHYDKNSIFSNIGFPNPSWFLQGSQEQNPLQSIRLFSKKALERINLMNTILPKHLQAKISIKTMLFNPSVLTKYLQLGFNHITVEFVKKIGR